MHVFRQKKCPLLLVWVFSIYVLQNLFLGDLVSAMTSKSSFLFLDSWDDLIARDDIEAVVAFNTESNFKYLEDVKEAYFPQGRYRQELTRKLTVLSADHYINGSLFGELLERVSEGKVALMQYRSVLECFTGRYSNLHVSQSGGRTEPYFLFNTWYTPVAVAKYVDET